MKMMRMLILLWIATALFVGCSDSDNTTGGQQTQPVDDGGPYTEKTVTIHRDGVRSGHVQLRFYASKADIPYISVSDFHRVMVPQASLSVTRQGDSYTVTTSGGTATIDVKGDQFTTAAAVSLFDILSLKHPGVPCAVSYDSSPYIIPKERQLLPAAATVTFDFRKYDIDLHDDGSQIFMPYATLADIYSDMNLNTTYYNDGDQELIVNHQLAFDDFDKMDPNRRQRIYGRQQVSETYAAYRYHELFFVFDYIYGYPGRDNALYRAGMEQCGFDAALDKCPSGAEVKKLLKSQDNAAFILGMDGLQQLAYDGGHTSVSQVDNIADLPAAKARWDDCAAQHPAAAALFNDFSQTLTGVTSYASQLKTLRQQTYGDQTYIASSDQTTAVIVLNSLMDLDYEGWQTYYASQKTAADWNTLLAREGNAVATFLSGLRQARLDGVKNIILDLTMNTGGSSDIVMTLLSLVTSRPAERQQVALYSDYVLTRQASTTYYVVDRNFDGRFDAADALVDNSQFNFAVLTSHRSFSCANLLPSVLKDSGIKVIGQRSGGGSCAIQFQFTPDGMMYIISCYRLRMLNAKGENIDSGIPVDITIPTEKFYDIDYLATQLAK